MAKTLFNYLIKNRNISFNELPINEVDYLVFACLGFLNNSYFLKEKEYSFNDLYNTRNRRKLLKGAVVPFWDYRLIKILSNSTRYKDFKITYARYLELPLEPVQYGVVNLYHPIFGNHIVFEGTNATIFGALEDLCFGTISGPKSYDYALEDIKKISKNGSDITLIGHSKGGTIAEYFGSHINELVNKQIVKVYNFDGPGFLFKEELNEESKNKIFKYITNKSVFGILLNTNCPYSYVKSKSFYLLHHMVYSWHISENSIVRTNKISSRSLKRRKYLDEFLSKHGDDDINKIISHSIEVMKQFNLYKPSDIRVISVKKGLKQLSKVYKGEDKELILEFIKYASKVFLP